MYDRKNAGQVGLGSSRPESIRPGSTRPGPIYPTFFTVPAMGPRL